MLASFLAMYSCMKKYIRKKTMQPMIAWIYWFRGKYDIATMIAIPGMEVMIDDIMGLK